MTAQSPQPVPPLRRPAAARAGGLHELDGQRAGAARPLPYEAILGDPHVIADHMVRSRSRASASPAITPRDQERVLVEATGEGGEVRSRVGPVYDREPDGELLGTERHR